MLPAADQAVLEKSGAAKDEGEWEDVEDDGKKKVAKTVEIEWVLEMKRGLLKNNQKYRYIFLIQF